MFHLLPHQTAFILKKELLYVPIFRHYVTGSGQIPVDRKAGASTIKNMVRSVRARIADGRDVVIFPEGTRSKYGQPSDYKPGVAALYSGVDADIVPVAHNSGKFWPRNSFWKRPGVVTVSFLPAIEKGLSKKEFAQELKKRIEDECAVIAAQKS